MQCFPANGPAGESFRSLVSERVLKKVLRKLLGFAVSVLLFWEVPGWFRALAVGAGLGEGCLSWPAGGARVVGGSSSSIATASKAFK